MSKHSPSRNPPEDPAANSGVSELSYEQAVEQVEAIIERIESGKIGLEQSLGEYERGVKLLRQCKRILESVELRVADLTRQMGEEKEGEGESKRGNGQ